VGIIKGKKLRVQKKKYGSMHAGVLYIFFGGYSQNIFLATFKDKEIASYQG
jgi:hypothetical protein